MNNPYHIIAIHYDANCNSQRIGEVKLLGYPSRKPRQAVINDITCGQNVKTAFLGNDGQYYEGADVHVVSTYRGRHLRTDRSSTERDNLGSLPVY